MSLPDSLPPGTYTLSVGWHRINAPHALWTDERSLLDGSRIVDITTIDLP
ncbi:MAG: hypothetical protein HC876_07935 [Chloroflexaceae bacterium]|nr:hypothetical protein [Chloroflexaceae bacterium]